VRKRTGNNAFDTRVVARARAAALLQNGRRDAAAWHTNGRSERGSASGARATVSSASGVARGECEA